MTGSLGAMIRAARRGSGLSLADLAGRVHISKSYLSRVESGERVPSDSVLAALAEVLGVTLPATTRQTYPGTVPTSDSVALVPVRQPDGSVIIEMMDRRAFLATATVVASAAAAPVPLPDPVTPDVLGALSDRLDWHTAAGRVAHPDTVAKGVQADLARIERAARNAPGRLRPDLLMLGSRYAEYLGWMRQDAGDDHAAQWWTNHAADLAHASGWWHMVSYTMTRKALMVQYDRPDHAADLARAARTGPWRITPGLTVQAASQQAEAHAHAGDGDQSRRALDVAHRALARVDPADEPPLGTRSRQLAHQLAMRTARCDLLLGRPERAIEYLAPVVAATKSARWRATDGALLATAYARVGSVGDACRAALSAVEAEAGCSSATATRELRRLRPELQPWAGRSDVDQVLAALPA